MSCEGCSEGSTHATASDAYLQQGRQDRGEVVSQFVHFAWPPHGHTDVEHCSSDEEDV